jgi:hypothetical protein
VLCNLKKKSAITKQQPSASHPHSSHQQPRDSTCANCVLAGNVFPHKWL